MADTECDGSPSEILSVLTDGLFDGNCEAFSLPESAVTESLDEILLALIALGDDETHGTGLMEDVGQLFGVQPSPGTVYPRLHDLEADGTLTRQELVQTKQYSIGDSASASSLLERAMYDHLVLGLFFQTALQRCNSR